jgi:hypothetical protein
MLVAGAALLSTTAARAQPAKPVSAARHRQAIAANTAGLRLYKNGQLQRAEFRFRDAVALDPSYALPHYNLACVASLLRESRVAVEQLAWLKASPDRIARAKLEKALVDPDLDFASALPEVRATLSLPTYDPAHTLAWLAERRGVWSGELPLAGCRQHAYTVEVHSGGDVSLRVRRQCGDGTLIEEETFAGIAHRDGADVRIEIDGLDEWPVGARLVMQSCPGLDAPGSCFAVANDSGTVLGPFHRGVPGLSPMRARKNVAAAGR